MLNRTNVSVHYLK